MSVQATGAAAAATRTRAGSGPWEAAQHALHRIGDLRVPELVLGFGMVFEGAFFGIPLPFNQLVLMAMILLAIMRRPTIQLGSQQMIVPFMVIGLSYIGLLSMFADPTADAADWKRRFIRLTLTAVALMVLAAGRLDLRSVFAGLGVGMVVNAVLFYAGIAPDTYGGVLSGFFMDKNVAGLSYAIYGILMLYLTEKRWARVVIFFLFAGLVWLTESRTSISGYLAAVLWIFLAPRLPVIGRFALGGAIYAAVRLASEDYSQIGIFSNRVGSDLLRSRIDAASEMKVTHAGFFGKGLGEAYVRFSGEDRTWFFHNSYWSALVEGGWPWLILLLGITLAFGMHPFRRVLTPRQVGAQAVVICMLVCAWRLGEVFMTPQWALAMAFAMQAFAVPDVDTSSREPESVVLVDRRVAQEA